MTILGSYIRRIPYLISVMRHSFGHFPRECSLCGYRGNFLAFGMPPRVDAQCPNCGSLERHRLFGVWMEQNGVRIAGKRVLHFAPESVISRRLRELAGTYRSADINPSAAEMCLDVENIALTEQSEDIVLCSHVLEHVDHKRALREIWRILKPGGTALLMFPIVEGWDNTISDPACVDPRQRELLFGQNDHNKYFGRDVRADIREAGFVLDEFTAIEPIVSRYGLVRGEKLFIATRTISATDH